MHIYNWDEWASQTIPVPLITGHEFMGEVVEVGDNVKRFKPTDRVTGEGHIICHQCRNCRSGFWHLCRNTKGVGVHRNGAFADYLVIDEHNVYPVADDIPDEIAALFDPFGNAVHTAYSFNLVGEDVLITGAGPIGIMGTLVAQAAGAKNAVLTDIDEHRLRLARKLGVRQTSLVGKETLFDVMKRLNMTEGFDVGLEMSGAPDAFRDMVKIMNNGGKIALLGIPPSNFAIDWNEIIFKMLTIKGIYGREMFDTWYKMTGLVQNVIDLTPLITHRFSCENFQKGFEAMKTESSVGKVILDWT